MESFLNGKIVLHVGDCMDVLPRLADDSLDSCVTDPPYHLTSIVKRFGSENAAPAKPFGKSNMQDKTWEDPQAKQFVRLTKGFMGKQWDGGDVAFRPETWAEVYRVLKPGAHLLAFGGTRTYHRMACAIEDAGFEIRDTIAYLYGSGFPKSHSVTKGLGDAICSCETIPECDLRPVRRDDVSTPVNTANEYGQVLFAGVSEQSASTSGRPQPSNHARERQSGMEGRRDISQSARQLRQREVRPMSTGIENDGASGRICDGASASDGAANRANVDARGMRASPGPSTVKQCAGESGAMALQSQPQISGAWTTCGRCGKPIVPDGFGTALKPALEPIVLARKPPSEKTVAANVLRWGTGAINVDGCRVATDQVLKRQTNGHDNDGWGMGKAITGGDKGRWPANVIHDGSDEVLAGFPETGISAGGGMKDLRRGALFQGETNPNITDSCGFGDEGSAARYFYTAKADSDDRIGSRHPTIKPLDLMQYLVRLVTPKGGTVLDPFAGTGTTGEAAFREGMKAVLIEREAEYQTDIRRRVDLCMAGPDERSREMIKARGLTEAPGPLFEWEEMWRKPFDREDLL